MAKAAKKEPRLDKKSLHYNNIYAIPESAANSIINAYAIPYAIALKASPIEIGLLSSVRNIAGTFAQVPGALLTEYFSRKSIWVTSMLIARLFWLPVVIMALLNTGNITTFIVFMAFFSFFLALNSPSWASMMGDMVPDDVRGRYFGKRNMLAGLSGMVATFTAGIMLAYGFAPIFALSFILSIIAIIIFTKIKEPRTKVVYHYRHSFTINLEELRDTFETNRNLVYFTIFISMMYFAVHVAGPFFVVYMLEDLAIGYVWFGIIV
ncbi:MAG: MFS transporter, partial [Nanoarchaeota archaeon]